MRTRKKKTSAAALRGWARTGRDVMLMPGELPGELEAAIVEDEREAVDGWLVHMLAAEQIGTALAWLARRVDAIVAEHAAPDPTSIRRWAGRGDR